MEGNGHTWNAARIDGKWCQMDLTWDDSSEDWYGDLDQRHLYFGLTDELTAIAHSDHTANYQAGGYAYRSTDLSNDCFVRNGRADEWASAYAERIQQHLDAKETSFSVDADTGAFPPSISRIQNAIIAYAMSQRDWSTADGTVTLTVTSSVTTISNYEWSARFDFEADYPEAPVIPERVIDDGEYRMASCADTSFALGCSGGSAVLTSSASTVSISRDEATGMYRVSALGRALRAEGWSARFAAADGSQAELWELRREGGAYVLASAATGLALDVPGGSAQDGKGVQTWTPNGTPAQSWAFEEV